jgi:iron complex outermembrane receptor protein
MKGKITDGLSIVANYAFTESIIHQSNDPVAYPEGSTVPGFSKHTANAWLNYTQPTGKLKGLGASIGGTFLGDRETDTWSPGAQKLPDYFKLDGGLSYETGKLRFTANMFNILDKYLYSGSFYTWLNAYYWQAEAPRNLRFGVTYKF